MDYDKKLVKFIKENIPNMSLPEIRRCLNITTWNIKNNNFNSSSFQCYYCNYYNAAAGELTATGNKFNQSSSFNIDGQTKFKKVTINDNEFNKDSYGLRLNNYSDWQWDRHKSNKGFEVLRNKFTKTHGGITANNGK